MITLPVITRQKYKDVLTEDAITLGYDIVQPKYDGHWVRVEVTGHRIEVYSRAGNLRFVETSNSFLPNVTLVGEYLFGTNWSTTVPTQGKVILFDCVRWNTDIKNLPYTSRAKILSEIIRHKWLTDTFLSTLSLPIGRAEDMWNHLVETNGYEGLIFRKDVAYDDDVVGRHKQEVTMDYVVMGMTEGEGKHSDSMGALKCGLYLDGELREVCSVGGGFTDLERQQVWQTPSLYIGRVLTAKGNCVFTSGALRSPNFVRWRDDKPPIECTYENKT